MADKEAFNKILKGPLTKKAKLDWLSQQTGQPVKAIQHLLDVKGRKGLKILGKRFGSNIDSLAGYLHELSIEHSQKKPGRSKRKIRSIKDITPFKKNLKARGHPNTLKTLHRLATVHEFPTHVIDDALAAGAPLKTLLKMLNSETLPSERIHQHLVDKTKEKMDVKAAANTVKKFDSAAAQEKTIDNLKNKITKQQGEIQDNLKKLNKEANKIRIIDRQNYQFKTLEAGANEFPNQPMTGSSKAAFKGNKWFTTNNLANAARLTIGVGKTIKNLAIGTALHAASDAYVAPHARRLGTKLGEEVLVPLGKNIDKAIENTKKLKIKRRDTDPISQLQIRR